ncbi:MAG: tRNA (adenosine(37)-N6)-threonylcarbamoyltransferase complex dimerization subunit type 1 TsaB [Clostridia bacterium]|nr:tRNA (adenosine(37)-N6)-threonylcarbamoyltransferase complex dimerization subunit type 1 TsaB [Clostridia bacterium]
MLAINTAFMTANLGIKLADKQVCREIDAKSKHSENVLKNIDEMCQEVGVDINEIETLAVVVGPGSFTGLRIGVSIAKALACVNKNLKLVAMSSLELMAYIISQQKICSQPFACVLNGLSGLFFVAEFDKDGKRLCEDKMITLEQLQTLDYVKIGLVGDNTQSLTEKQIEFSSEDVLSFAQRCKLEEKYVEEKDLLPVYLRLSQAEDNLNLKKMKN